MNHSEDPFTLDGILDKYGRISDTDPADGSARSGDPAAGARRPLFVRCSQFARLG